VTEQGVVEKVKGHIARYDRLVSLFGMTLEEVGPGSARVSMKVGGEHLNAAGVCHGAVIFALADVAFALASNSYGNMALALEASINYFRPVSPGSTIAANVTEKHRGRSTGFYHIEVTDAQGRLVADFKATAFVVEDSPLREKP
jgi:acyl-CoA thioesterase